MAGGCRHFLVEALGSNFWPVQELIPIGIRQARLFDLTPRLFDRLISAFSLSVTHVDLAVGFPIADLVQ